MKRKIFPTPQYTTTAEFPLVTDDVNAYEIEFDIGQDVAGAEFKVIAIRADGKAVEDLGEINDGVATYTLANNMYAVPGKLVVRLQILHVQSVLTDREIVFRVVEGVENTIDGETTSPLLDKMILRIQEAEKQLNEKAGKKDVYTKSDMDGKLESMISIEQFMSVLEFLVPMIEKVNSLPNVYRYQGSVYSVDSLPYCYKFQQTGDITGDNGKLIGTFDNNTGVTTFTDNYGDYESEIRRSFVWRVPIEKFTLKGGLYYHPLEDFGDFEYTPCGYFVRTRLPQLIENSTVVNGMYYLENDIEIDTVELYYNYMGWMTFSIEEFTFDFNIIGVKNPNGQTFHASNGDVYNTLDTGMNYAWNGTEWDSLGGEHKDIEAREMIEELYSKLEKLEKLLGTEANKVE